MVFFFTFYKIHFKFRTRSERGNHQLACTAGIDLRMLVQTVNQLRSRVSVLEALWFNALRQQPIQISPFPPTQAPNRGIVQVPNGEARTPNAGVQESELEIEVIDVQDVDSE